jgi:hypothetical protein
VTYRCSANAASAARITRPFRLFRLMAWTSVSRCLGGAQVEHVIGTRDGRQVAELRPLPRPSARPTELIERRRRLPRMDPEALRRDIDTVVDPTL